MRELPEGWAEVKLGDLIQFNYGKSLPERSRSGKGFTVYGSNGIVGYHQEALSEGETLIIGRKGSIGEIDFSSNSCFPIDTTYYIDKFYEMPIRYWFYQLKGLRLSELNKSTAIPGLNREDAYKLDVYLPPLNEQKRIADRLDQLLTRIDKTKAHLDRIPPLLKRFRQSVLAIATSGKLTADWREESLSLGNGEQLLQSIREDRYEMWKHDLIQKGKDWKKIKYKMIQHADIDKIYSIPKSWAWTSLGELTWSVKDGPHYTPQYSESGIPFISGGNITPDGIDFENTRFISPELHQELSERCCPQLGDILYTKGGTTGIARVNTYEIDFNVWVHVSVLKCLGSIESFGVA